MCKHASGGDVTFFSTNTYIKCILVSEIIIWFGLCRITSSKMENTENSLKIDVVRPVNLPFFSRGNDVMMDKR